MAYPFDENCYYINPDCPNKATQGVNRFHIDVWLEGYGSCDDHVAYLLEWFKRNGDYGVVKQYGD